MKRSIAFVLSAALLFCLLAGCGNNAPSGETTGATDAQAATSSSDAAPTASPDVDYSNWKVALLTEESSVTDLSLNQVIHDAGKAWCEARGVSFRHYTPKARTKAELVALIDLAVADGNTVLLLPDWSFTDAIKDSVGKYQDVYFVLFDIYTSEFGRGYVLPANVCTVNYQEHILGFMAGYAAVKLGSRHLCFMGAAKTTPVNRYGYGFVQGANAAAVELGTAKEIAVEYVYANSLSADSAITAYMKDMYQNRGIELCFACGGDIVSSACEAAQGVSWARVIGADVDRMQALDAVYGEGVNASAAVKNYAAAVQTILSDLVEYGRWRKYTGQSVSLGIVSDKNPAENYIGLAPSTRFADGKFSEADYAALVAALYARRYAVSDDVKNPPMVEIAVNYLGNIK